MAKHVVVGTAGHIDHGKTSLVRALTGIDTDRLEEEKRRGISIDLGFAHLQVGDELRIAFIDVPGHEKFIRNMLAGIGGIDLALLVVAADESIMPQTREHFAICRMLQIPRGIVVLTKADLVGDPTLLELVRLEVDEMVAGSFLEGAPVLPVSARTGQGLPELKKALVKLSESVPRRPVDRPFRLPVDRSFALKGFGTVVTGTALSGIVKTEEDVEVDASGKLLRVRGLQVHGARSERGQAGQRLALNVAGATAADLPRGSVLATPGAYLSTRQVDTRLQLLPGSKELKHRSPVHFHIGTAEIHGELRLPNAGKVRPGEEVDARFVFPDPVLVAPGDRFIIRLFSPVVTIGGGVILDTLGPRRVRDMPGRNSLLAQGNPTAIAALLVRENAFGISVPELARRRGWSQAEARSALKNPDLAQLSDRFVDRTWLQSTLDQWVKVLAEDHRARPLQPGFDREEFRSRYLPTAPLSLFEDLVLAEPRIASDQRWLRLTGHQPSLRQDENEAKSKIEKAFATAGFAVPSEVEVLSASGLDAARAQSILQILIREGRLARVSKDLVFHTEALGELRKILSAHKGSRFGVGEFKTWTGISRKYAIPLLEFFDRERLTRRDGDSRLVL
jgi:selenocysteine-specific elongation factor